MKIYKKGDIGVRINKGFAGNHFGSIYKAIADRDNGSFCYAISTSMYKNDVRPATQKEINAYNRGIRNINDIPKTINYEVYG